MAVEVINDDVWVGRSCSISEIYELFLFYKSKYLLESVQCNTFNFVYYTIMIIINNN